MTELIRRHRSQGVAVLAWLTLVASLAAAVAATALTATPAGAADCSNTSTGLIPLIDLDGEYQGRPGGLYPDGNEPTGDHLARGAAAAAEIAPRDADGDPEPGGKVVFLGIGGSVLNQEFGPFVDRVRGGVNPDLVMVNAGIGGRDLRDWVAPGSDVWDVTQTRLDADGVTAAQVQAVWIKNVWGRHGGVDFPTWVQNNLVDTRTLVEEVSARFPNVAQIYLSSRSYGGYIDRAGATTEPYAYEHGFAVKDFVAENLDRTEGPWIGWGPYLWTDGVAGRSDGLVWRCEDVSSSGSHPSDLGEAKFAALLDDFFSSSPTSGWFRAGGVEPGQPAVISVDPSSLAPGVTAQVVVSGSSLPPEAILSLGSGVEVTETVVTGSNSLTARASVAGDADLGPRDVVVTDTTGDRSGACAACFAVAEQSNLSVSSASPPTIETGATSTVTLAGTGFGPGTTVQVTPPRRVKVVSVEVLSTTSLEVVLDARTDAPTGARTLTVGVDGQSVTCACLTVVEPGPDPGPDPGPGPEPDPEPDPDPGPDPDFPTVTSADPDTVERGAATEVVLTGTGFAPGTSVALSPARRVQITGQSVTGPTQIVLNVDVRNAAPLGLRNLVVTTPDGQSVTCACLTVVESGPDADPEPDPEPAPDPEPVGPQVTGVVPDTFTAGSMDQVVVVGSGFLAGAFVEVSPPQGVEVTNVIFATENELVITLDAHALAPLGPRNLTVTNPGTQTTTCTACFTVVAPG